MYCPACGSQLTDAATYCKRCGANLVAWKPSGELERAHQTMDTLVWVIVGTTITLLGMALGALVIMKDGGIDPRFGGPFVVLCFLAFVMVETVLVLRLLQLNKNVKETRLLAQPYNLITNELDSTPAALNEPVQSIPSVTEQTTRTLEPAHKERERI
jgi:hypothetical protein